MGVIWKTATLSVYDRPASQKSGNDTVGEVKYLDHDNLRGDLGNGTIKAGNRFLKIGGHLIKKSVFLYALTFGLAFVAVSGALAQENTGEEQNYDQKFYCDAQKRFLSDEAFVRLALRSELERQPVGYYRPGATQPERYEIGPVDVFLKNNPDGFHVVRDPKNMRNQGRSWMARLEDWLDGEQIAIYIFVPSDTVGEPKLVLSYYTDECGTINGGRGYRISNDHITE